MKTLLDNSSTENLIKLAEHLVAVGPRDLGYALLLIDVMMLLDQRLPVSAMSRLKDDLRATLGGRQPSELPQ